VASSDAPAQALILLLVFATPLALGTVHLPVVMAFQWLVLVLVLLWVVRLVWVPPAYVDSPGVRADVPGRSLFRIFGHQLVSTRLGIPILLFAALVLLQLVPVPPSLMRLLSPSTARLYEDSLPGYGSEEGVEFSGLGSFLLGPGNDAVVQRILETPGELPLDLASSGNNLRTISVYPFATLRQLFVFLTFAGLFLVTVNVFRSRARIEAILRAIVLYGFAYALFGIVQRLSWNGKIFWIFSVDQGASPFGSFINHNHFAALLAMIVPVATGMLMDEARQLTAGRSGAGEPPPARRGMAALIALHGPEPFARLFLAAFVVAVIVAAIVLSASRGAVLALGTAFLFYGGALVAQGRIRRPEAVVGIILLAVAAALSIWLGVGPLAEKIYAIGSVETEPSLFSRIVGWRWTMKIISDHPVLGTGLGTFPQAWARYYPPGTAAVWSEAHNDYLQLFSESWIVGFVIFVAAFAIFIWRYLLPGILLGGRGERYAMHGVAVGITTIALHSVVDFPLQINGCAVLFVVLSSLLIAHRLRMEAAA
jgi:O-antigen ligase